MPARSTPSCFWPLTPSLSALLDVLRDELGLFLLSFPTQDEGEGEDYVILASSKAGTSGMGLCSTPAVSSVIQCSVPTLE